jgi:regulator of extracellular matrix RemA (YlzA/DUF370 family)
LGRLTDLKYGKRVRAMEIAESDHDFRRAIRLRKQINKLQELESGLVYKSHPTIFETDRKKVLKK